VLKEKVNYMDSKVFSDWLASLSIAERISVLARIYSQLTIGTRAFLLPETAKGKEQSLIKVLQGINELHHTIANWLVPYTIDASEAFPVEVLSQQLFQIGKQYRIEEFLTSVIQFIYTRSPARRT